ncbi:MAG: DegT/DnrJ/EryC1/StrS family aminotransferase [Balneolaceae bacterium]|nr:DegT/DnrJ/EryC1/StrS family aminotransferase [Balneolaceae bacterium]
MIPVTKPFMPPAEEYQKYLEEIWDRGILTNNGPLVKRLEAELKEFLKVENLLYVSNGTIALQIAIKALGLKGEIITTPFSYVATTSSIVWEGCKPVFVDIDPETFNMDPNLIESAITENTTAILATHVFGNPCDINTLQTIADKYGLKVIYDAAHCFGTTYKGETVFNFGDVSTVSFHATKLFHTIEGGAVFTKDQQLYRRMRYMRNFGHDGPGKFNGVGVNGKNSEFHAAMGLCNLPYMGQIMEKRKEQCALYDELLLSAPVQTITIQKNAEWNYAYYPVLFDCEETAQHVKYVLEEQNIHPRRYFYPSLETLEYVDSKVLKNSQRISSSILCLPLFHNLIKSDQERIAKLITQITA